MTLQTVLMVLAFFCILIIAIVLVRQTLLSEEYKPREDEKKHIKKIAMATTQAGGITLVEVEKQKYILFTNWHGGLHVEKVGKQQRTV